MAVIARHLRCDCIEAVGTGSCPIRLLPPSVKEEHTYYHCPLDNYDYICDRGIVAQFEFDSTGAPKNKIMKCFKCGTVLEEKQWPERKSG